MTTSAHTGPGAVVALEAVSKFFGGLGVIHQLSFDVNRGEIVGLLEANGSGKTMAMNPTSGLLAPDAGRRAHPLRRA